MLKRQKEGARMSDPVLVEASMQMLAAACPDQPIQTWELLRTTLEGGFQSIDRRLQEVGPLEPNRFNLAESKTLLENVQRLIVAQQVDEDGGGPEKLYEKVLPG